MASNLWVKKQRWVLNFRRKKGNRYTDRNTLACPLCLSVVIRVELHTVDDFLCFLDFRLDLCFEPHDFELFGKKMEGKDRNRKVKKEKGRKQMIDGWLDRKAETETMRKTQKKGGKKLMNWKPEGKKAKKNKCWQQWKTAFVCIFWVSECVKTERTQSSEDLGLYLQNSHRFGGINWLFQLFKISR